LAIATAAAIGLGDGTAGAATYLPSGAYSGAVFGTQWDRSLMVGTESTTANGVVQAALESAKVVVSPAQVSVGPYQTDAQLVTLTTTLETKATLPGDASGHLYWQPVTTDTRRAKVAPSGVAAAGSATFPATALSAPGPAADTWTFYRLVYDLVWVSDATGDTVSTLRVVPDSAPDVECATFALLCQEGPEGGVTMQWPPLRPRA
jgi:hypothetical protein